MNVISAVYQGLKRKKSNASEAQRLGLSLNQYALIKETVINVLNEVGPQVEEIIVRETKQRLFSSECEFAPLVNLIESISLSDAEESKRVEIHENLEDGTSKITGIASEEPRTPEEIIEVLKIDTTKWKLVQYWNKEKRDRWLVSALVKRLPEAEIAQASFLELLQDYEIPKIIPLDPTAFWSQDSENLENVCGVLSLQDLHFGKTGNEEMGEVMMSSVKYLVGKAYKNYTLKKLILVLGPDTLNMDTFGGTTTKGTPVENSQSATDTYIQAFNAICQAVGFASQFAEELEIAFIPGNHDRLSSFHLLHAVSQAFKDWDRVNFNINYAERKVITYGQNMICLEHGDVSAKNNPLVYAVEFPKEWGASRFRILYTGHYHGRRTKEFTTENEEHGFITKILPALTSSDYYHYHNKYVGNKRAAILHIHDENDGLITEFTYNHQFVDFSL